MSKLTQKKIEWIIKQKENRVSTSEIARIMKVTPRYVNMIYQKYREEGKVEIKNPGRKKDPIGEGIKKIIYRVKEEHPTSGALAIEKYLKERSIKISHNKIHEILKEGGMVMEDLNKKKQRKWVRWERKHSNSLWHMDWFEYEGKNYVVIEDDASRFIVNFKAYEHATSENSKEALKEAINKHDIPREVMTDHGTQFTSLPREGKESEPNEFQKYLEEMGITHIKAKVKHPQTNGKLERLIFTLKDLKKYFDTWVEIVNYYNYKRMHMSLYEDRIITPAMAYEMKKAKEREILE